MKLLLAFLTFVEMFGAGVSSVATECQLWDDVVKSTMDETFLNVTCRRNDLCNGVSCSGSFLYQHQMFMGSEPFGFAVEFLPCSYPLILHIRLNSSDLSFSKLLGVGGRSEQSILLMAPGEAGLEEPYGRLNLVWNSILRPVKYFVAIEINFTRIYVEGEFLPVTLVPLRNFPIPNCQYDNSDDSIRPPNIPSEGGCVLDDCDQSYPPTSKTSVKYGFVFEVCIVVGVILVALCVCIGIVLVRHNRRANLARKLKAETEFTDEDDDNDLLVMSQKSEKLYDDRRTLLNV